MQETLLSAPSRAPAVPAISTLKGARGILCGNPLYCLLPTTGVALILQFVNVPDGAVFAVASVALLPLAGLLGELTEQVALHTSDTLGGLLNATMGNATELIVSCFALQRGLLRVVIASLLGSILSNLLLVLGSALIVAGVRVGNNRQQEHNLLNAQSNTELLMIATFALAIPELLFATDRLTVFTLLALSRAVAALLLVLYSCYVAFQLCTHPDLFEEGPDDDEQAGQPPPSEALLSNADGWELHRRGRVDPIQTAVDQALLERGFSGPLRAGVVVSTIRRASWVRQKRESLTSEGGEDEIKLPLTGAIFLLAVVTVLVALLSEVVTSTIEGAAKGWNLHSTFVAFVIIPIVGNP